MAEPENKLDIDVVEDIGNALPPNTTEEANPEDESSLGMKEETTMDYSEQMKQYQKKQTVPYLTKYERTRIIGFRAEQLNRGAIPTVEIGNLRNTTEIAEKELRERTIPLKIIRKLPNGTIESWRIQEFIL